jgi:oligopeptide transport system permease protein
MFTRGALLYIGQRLVLIVFTAVAVSSIVFLGVHRLPGDALLNERRPDPAAEAELLRYYHLDLPLPQQYVRYVTGLLHGDLGESYVNRGVQIAPLLLREARVSGEVGAAAIVFTIGIGVLLGVIAAVRQNTWVDYLATTTSIIGYSMPNFVIASLLFLLFAVGLYNWTGGALFYNSGWTGTYGTLDQILIPGFALGFPYASIVARLTRASMLEVIRQDYVRTARAKGLTSRVVVVRHALRNALIPVVTILGPLVIGIVTGSVVIENIFGIPGLGKEFATSILNRDYNIVIGLFTIYAVIIALANLAVDLLYTVIDPRIRY